MGRPTSYSDEHDQSVCEWIAAGKSLHSWCEGANRPKVSTVLGWLTQYPNFSERYARAREASADKLADEIVEIADGEGDPNDKRVRVDARKWVAAKLKPKTYGDKVELNTTVDIKVTPDDRLESRLTLLLGKAGIIGDFGGAGTEEGEASAMDLLPGPGPTEA